MTAGDQPAWEETAQRALELLRAGDDEAAWTLIDDAARDRNVAVPGPSAGFREVGRILYWTHGALPEYVRLQQEQMRRYDGKPSYVGRLTGVLYDLATFTWPGWGHEVREEERSVGREAATACVALREDPELSAVEFTITPAMAHWVAGAHALADGDFDRARSSFSRARERNVEAGEDDVLDRGYLRLADVLERPGDSQGEAELQGVLDELERCGGDEADFIRSQLETARRVLGDRQTG